MRRTVPEIKAEDATPTNEANMMLIKRANTTNKVGMAHKMEASVLQTTAAVVVENVMESPKL
jgi:hypothetical protein